MVSQAVMIATSTLTGSDVLSCSYWWESMGSGGTEVGQAVDVGIRIGECCVLCLAEEKMIEQYDSGRSR